MTRPTSRRSEASSAAMSPFTAEAARPRIAGSVVGQSGSPAALTRMLEAMAGMKAASLQALLQQAVIALQGNDFQTGGELAVKALEIDERSGFGWYLLAIARERAGDFAGSVRCYESALALIPDHAEVANDLGRLAYRMGMKETAEKLFLHYVLAHPGATEPLNNLACAIRDQGRYSEAIDVIRPALMAAPGDSLLWNTLGTVLSEEGDPAAAATFFDEALRLDPSFAKARYNRANIRLFLGDPQGALLDCEQALSAPMAVDELQMMRLARSTMHLATGDLEKGWRDYESRRDPGFADVTHVAIDRPEWTPGADLKGRSLLLVGEQGLGDEVLFANLLPDVLSALGDKGRLTLALEPRLVSLFQRSFPTARVGAHATFSVDGHTVRVMPFLTEADLASIDLWAPLASPLQQFRAAVEAFPDRPGYMRPDPARVEHWRRVLAEAPAGPKVGLLWKSMSRKGGRHRFFSPFALWEPILKTPGLSLVNLQYGDCDEELAQARTEFGVDIWTPPGIDLKQDLDDVAALTSALDLTIGFANASLNLAGACGAPVWLISPQCAWTMVGTERYPWYPQARVFLPRSFGDWEPVMQDVAVALTETFGLGTEATSKG